MTNIGYQAANNSVLGFFATENDSANPRTVYVSEPNLWKSHEQLRLTLPQLNSVIVRIGHSALK